MIDSAWKDTARRYPRGTAVRGRVTATEAYGAYVEVEPGVEGLLRVGPDGLTNSAFAVGDEIEVIVVEVDEARHLMHFGIRQ